jgi:hypothetical protein
MWQEQLISLIEENSLDPDHIADLLVAYEAETGDSGLRGCGVEVLMFMGAFRPWSGSDFWSGSGSGSRYGSVSGSLSGFWSRSRSMSESGSGSGSGFWSGSRSRYWSRSRSGSRSGSGSK